MPERVDLHGMAGLAHLPLASEYRNSQFVPLLNPTDFRVPFMVPLLLSHEPPPAQLVADALKRARDADPVEHTDSGRHRKDGSLFGH